MLRIALMALLLTATMAIPVAAQITVFEDDFESYASDFDLWFTWEPANGDGSIPPPVDDNGILTTDDSMFPGIDGQAVAHIGGSINQWFPVPDFFDPLNMDDVLEPTEEHSIVFGGDLFVGTSNTRLSIGLRSNAPANLLELGAWNTDFKTLAYRVQLFQSGNVNWQFFDLPLSFDTSGDGNVTFGDIGPAWHRYQATVTPTMVTFELDVFRDGTVDATSEVPVQVHSAFFDSFRIGGPSGVGSIGEGAFDNVFLRLVETMPGGGDGIDGDYNDSGTVEQGDLDLVLLNWGDNTPPIPNGWINDLPNGLIDQEELDGVLLAWGNTAGLGAANVPEPTTLALALAATLVVALSRRRNRRPA